MIFDNEFDYFTLLPRHSELSSRSEIDLTTDYGGGLVLSNPLISAPMSSVTGRVLAGELSFYGGIGILHRYTPWQDQLGNINYVVGHCQGSVMQAISSKWSTDVEIILKSRVSGLVIDVAHGDTKACIDLVKAIRDKNDKISIVSGNIVTSEAAYRLKLAGVTSFRVGIGAGHACITRRVAGIGRNQLRAIRDVFDVGLPILACGGIRHSGDIVKCLAAGASGVIIGKLFSTTTESSAKRIGNKVVYAGMASHFAEDERAASTGESRDAFSQHGTWEGEHQILEETGSLGKTIQPLLGGIRAGLAYLGCRNIKELHALVDNDELEWENVYGDSVEV